MKTIYYIGLDVHKKTVACCIKDPTGRLIDQKTGKVSPEFTEFNSVFILTRQGIWGFLLVPGGMG